VTTTNPGIARFTPRAPPRGAKTKAYARAGPPRGNPANFSTRHCRSGWAPSLTRARGPGGTGGGQESRLVEGPGKAGHLGCTTVDTPKATRVAATGGTGKAWNKSMMAGGTWGRRSPAGKPPPKKKRAVGGHRTAGTTYGIRGRFHSVGGRANPWGARRRGGGRSSPGAS